MGGKRSRSDVSKWSKRVDGVKAIGHSVDREKTKARTRAHQISARENKIRQSVCASNRMGNWRRRIGEEQNDGGRMNARQGK